jgi:hypothetical protein
MVLILVVAVMVVGLSSCKAQKDTAAENEALRAKLNDAIAANAALTARLKLLDPAFAAALDKAEAGSKTGEGKASVNTSVKTEVKLIDLNLLSPREESKPASGTGGGTNTDVKTEVKLIDLGLLNPSTNDQVRALQSTIQVLSNRIAQQDAEISRLTTKLAKHGINPAPE